MFDYLVRFCEEGRDKDVFVLICLYTRQKNEVKKNNSKFFGNSILSTGFHVKEISF